MRTPEHIKILCISPLFVPLSDPEAFCGAKLVRALLDEGANVTVLWSSNFKFRDAGQFDDSGLWEPLRGVSVDVPVPPRRTRLRGLSSALRYQTRFGSRWVRNVVRRALDMHSRVPFDLVYSRSVPMLAHVAGYWCARQLNLPWVANINDPWDCHRSPTRALNFQPSRLGQFVSEHWLKKTLESAALVTFPCMALISHHGVPLEMTSKVHVLPHVGCTFTDFAHAGNEVAPGFNLLHAGRLSGEESGRSTRALMFALANFLARTPRARRLTRFILVGTEDPETKDLGVQLGLGDNIRFTGRVSYENSLREISSATVCVVIEAAITRGIFLPSKLVDYIAARKPILALSPAIGVAADMAAAGQLLRVDPEDIPAIEAGIAVLYSEFARGTLHSRVPEEAFARQFDPKVVARRFLEAVGGVLSTATPKLKVGKTTADQ